MLSLYQDRRDAGGKMAALLARYANDPGVIVLALPRGGVPVGYEVARALGAPLDVFVVRKLGVPGHEELAMGAVATGGVVIVNDSVVNGLGIPDKVIAGVLAQEEQELERRERQYRGDRPAPELKGRTVILVDDGLATGSTMRAAVQAVRQQDPASVVVAVPVAASSTCEEFRSIADHIVCAATPEPFYAVGLWYKDFTPTTDDDVNKLLADARARGPSSLRPGAGFRAISP